MWWKLLSKQQTKFQHSRTHGFSLKDHLDGVVVCCWLWVIIIGHRGFEEQELLYTVSTCLHKVIYELDRGMKQNSQALHNF